MDVLIILKNIRCPDDRFGCGLGSRKLECARHGHRLCDAACIVWIDGWIESKASLVIQNVILLFINVIGVWRWYPRAEKEAKG